MKKVFGSLAAIILVFLAFSGARAQERKISAEEFLALSSKNASQGKPLRVRKSQRVYKKDDDSLIRYFEEVAEFLPPDKSRSVIDSGSSPENLFRSESVRIGQTMYQKNRDGTWRQYPVEIRKPSTQAKIQSEGETNVEYFYVGRTSLKNQPADLYESRSVTKIMRNGAETRQTETVKKWLKPDGTPLQDEMRSESAKDYSIVIFEYEYDPSIEIEAPIK